ncbi:hypothetical protein Mpsy_1537 [Methanolobus psychrophilus R15]|nr:hypothetical protein Mpsy_1537 [Methanolobus psychrophilus R15]
MRIEDCRKGTEEHVRKRAIREHGFTKTLPHLCIKKKWTFNEGILTDSYHPLRPY